VANVAELGELLGHLRLQQLADVGAIVGAERGPFRIVIETVDDREPARGTR